jgi:hypothetical protein
VSSGTIGALPSGTGLAAADPRRHGNRRLGRPSFGRPSVGTETCGPDGSLTG